MSSTRSRIVVRIILGLVITALVALVFVAVSASGTALAASDSSSSGGASSNLGGLALPSADDSDDANESAGSAVPSSLGGLAAPSSGSASTSSSGSNSGSSLGGLAAPGSSNSGSSSGSGLAGLAAPGSSSGSSTESGWSPLDGDWTYDLECEACHAKQVDSFEKDEALAKNHAVLECAFCHGDEEELTEVHSAITAKTSEPTALVHTEIDTEELCETCHDPKQLVEVTADSKILTDDNGTVINPHDIPQNDKHADTTCISCHKVHSTTTLEKAATRYCKGCHHAGVYECNTCHAA